MKRGDIYYADLRPVVGSEQGGIRPVLIIQNDTGNMHSPTLIVCAITSKLHKHRLPTHVHLDCRDCSIMKNSVVLLEQVRTIDKARLKNFICHLNFEQMKKVDEAIKISMAVS